MNILVINAGSSSLKYQVIDMKDEAVLTVGLIERIGQKEAAHQYKLKGIDYTEKKQIVDHNEAVEVLIEKLLDKKSGVITSMKDIDAVGHRVAHGGSDFMASALILENTLNAIKDNIELAPLHNPANVIGIEACKKVMADTPMVAVFDTAFHQTMPKKAYLYGLPYEAYLQYKIRRYGFHGTSHKFIAQRTAEMMGRDIDTLKIISCHLGNGASMAAIKYGISVDTSMGFTPLEGLVMGTRCGDIDPSIPEYISDKLGAEISIGDYLNKKSGLLGLSGKSNDFRDLWKYANQGDEQSLTAIAVYCYRIKKYIGAYIAAMGGADAIVFSAGIGENDTKVREMILEDLSNLGIVLDKKKNANGGKEQIISTHDSTVCVAVVKTNEELMIARETAQIICHKYVI